VRLIDKEMHSLLYIPYISIEQGIAATSTDSNKMNSPHHSSCSHDAPSNYFPHETKCRSPVGYEQTFQAIKLLQYVSTSTTNATINQQFELYHTTMHQGSVQNL
jgi:hypothetical protein